MNLAGATIAPNMSELFLNGFSVSFTREDFTGYIRPMPDNQQLEATREALGDEWFISWRDGIAYGLPKLQPPSKSFGTAQTLKVADHLSLLARRLTDVLPEKFPKYEAFRRKPFKFRGQKDEIVAAIMTKLKRLPPVVGKFKIHLTFELDARLIELHEGELQVGLFVDIATNWQILAPLDELQAAGIDVAGLYVVRLNPDPTARRLVGRVKELVGQKVILSEAHADATEVFVDDVLLEGSRASFAHCLKQLLGRAYDDFEKERQEQEGFVLVGNALDERVGRMGEYLQKASPFTLCQNFECSIGERIPMQNVGDYKTVVQAPTVDYCFDAARSKRNKYAWPGLENFGPFSRDTLAKKSPRILFVFPDSVQGPAERFLRYFRDGISSIQNSRYSGGFAKIYGLVNPQFVTCRIPLFPRQNDSPAETYRRTISDFLSRDAQFDAAIVTILNEHARLPDSQNPYLHSKAVLLMAGIPVQDVRVFTISQSEASLQFNLQNISVALYAKLNGIPWTVDHDLSIADELVLGLGTCETGESRFEARKRFIGITTVFRGDGNYLLSNLSSECGYDDYPEVLQRSTVEVLKEIKKRNGWQPGDTVRVVVHSFKPLKKMELARIMKDAVATVGNEQNMEFAFLTVTQDHPFRLFDRVQQGIPMKNQPKVKKAVFVPQRGVVAQLGSFTRLLCTNGPELIKRPVSPLPLPLLVHIHPESTYRDLASLAEQVLKFTSLSWRSTLPAKLPVTIYYSELIAGLLSRLRGVPDWSPAMLNIKLRASKWFL
jgi:hypothetical protein